MAALEVLSKQFVGVLDAEDENDGAALEKVLDDMQTETDFTRWIVSKLNQTMS